MVANNADRKSGHVLFDNDRLWAIDHGVCFNEDDKLRTVIWDYAGEPVEDDVRAAVQRLADGQLGALAHWLDGEELRQTQRRAGDLADSGCYPIPNDDGDWPPYPWPLI